VANRPNIYIDSFSITTYPANQTFSAASVDFQSTASTAAGLTNQEIIRLKVTVNGDGNPAVNTTILQVEDWTFNTNGCTNWNSDVANAKLYYSGGEPSLDVNNALLLQANTNTGWLGNYAFLLPAAPPGEGSLGGLYPTFNQLRMGDNYFWITYDITGGAVGGNFVDAEWVEIGYRSPSNAATVTYAAPAPQTLPGSREIDLAYCIPSYWVGTAWAGYTNNDYIARVILTGDVLPGIDNNQNTNGPNAGACLGIPTTCPFSAHPPDYELFPPNPGYTATLTADGSTFYQIRIQVGTWFSSNYVAAWIDFNKDGTFNNTIWSGGGEKLCQSPSLASNTFWSAPLFQVPFTSATGNIRLRVREVYARSNIQPCTQYTYGETEDYTVTILPPCAPAWPGWKTWLGYTDDWDNPSNWCGGVPTINDNARLPAGFTGSTPYTYVRPKIKAGVLATTRTLRIEPNDTLYIDAATNSSLHVSDTLSIHNNSLLTINSTFIDTAQASNGTLNASQIAMNPFKAFFPRVRNQWTFTQAELAAKGLQDKDIITELKFHMRRQEATNTIYTNVKIKVYYTTFLHCYIVNPTPAVPSGATTLLYNGNVDVGAITPNNTSGTVSVPLTTPFTFDGLTTDKLVIDISYDNTGNPTPFAWQLSSHTQTLGCASFISLYNAPSPNAGNPENYTWGMGGVNGFLTEVRPNITFEYDRPYDKYPIEVNGHWHNDGDFVPAISEVTMKGAGLPQFIKGLSSTTFYDLTIDNVNTVTRMTDLSITDTLTIQNGRFRLNGGTVHMNNPDVGSVVRVAGGLESETNATPYGMFHWDLGTQPGVTAVIPFINSANVYIPVDYNMDAGSHDMYFATYGTPPDNLPIPADLAGPPAPVVTNINGYNGLNNSGNMVDRYWKIYNLGTAPQSDITFRYANSEIAALGNTGNIAQRWVLDAGSTTPGQGWENPGQPGQIFAPNVVTVPDFSLFNENIWWAIVNGSVNNPLPVELLSFTAKPDGDKVRLNWSTASELNNDYYEIERTANMSEFSFIDRVSSRGPSTWTLNYETWDMNPLRGMQYYYLRQYDVDGQKTSYGPVAVNMDREGVFEIVTASVAPTAEGITIIFNYDSQEPYSFMVIDMQGRVVAKKDNQRAIEGLNVLKVNANLARGVYQVVLRNTQKVVTRKLFY
jgi:hypothetical protein